MVKTLTAGPPQLHSPPIYTRFQIKTRRPDRRAIKQMVYDVYFIVVVSIFCVSLSFLAHVCCCAVVVAVAVEPRAWLVLLVPCCSPSARTAFLCKGRQGPAFVRREGGAWARRQLYKVWLRFYTVKK